MTNIFYPLGAPCEDMSEGEYQRQYTDDDSWEETALDAPRGYWLAKEGRRLIANMTSDHLRNAITYEERAGNGNHPKVTELRTELAKR
jgi:hypothetical protein